MFVGAVHWLRNPFGGWLHERAWDLGISNLERASFVTTLCFMTSGIVTTFAIHHFFAGVGS